MNMHFCLGVCDILVWYVARHLRETCLLLREKSAAVHTDVFKVLQITRPLTQEKYC
jgi:hypothetical protein